METVRLTLNSARLFFAKRRRRVALRRWLRRPRLLYGLSSTGLMKDAEAFWFTAEGIWGRYAACGDYFVKEFHVWCPVSGIGRNRYCRDLGVAV